MWELRHISHKIYSQEQRLWNEKAWRRIFFLVYHWPVFVSQIGPQLPLWLSHLDFEIAWELTWAITHVERCFYWPTASHLTCSVFGGVRLSDLEQSQVLFWFCLFLAREPFLSESEGVFPFSTATQTQLAGAWEEGTVGRQGSYRRSAGPPHRSSEPSAQTALKGHRGEDGGQEEWEDGGMYRQKGLGECRQFICWTEHAG